MFGHENAHCHWQLSLSSQELSFHLPIPNVDPIAHSLLVENIKLRERVLQNQHEQAERTEVRYQTEQERRCHQSLACIYQQYKDVNPNRVPETCKWVLNHDRFQAWRQSRRNDLLWISADPGSGKSVLSKFLVDHEFHDTHRTSVCYFFFKDNEQQESLVIALKALLHRLFSHQPQLLCHAVPVWGKKGDKAEYKVKEMWGIFLAAATDSKARPTVCVLGALDECREGDRSTLITFLGDFHRSVSSTASDSELKFLVTSRPYDSVQRWFEQITELPQIRLQGEYENDKIHEEINLVIDQRVNELASKFHLSSSHRDRLRQKLVQMEHRTYLWLHLAMEEIRDTYQDSLYPNKVQIASLPISVDHAYERILQKVDVKATPNARKVLLIILGARRPLTIGEMALALGAAEAQESDSLSDGELNKARLEEQIRQWCGLFVFINHSKLFLIHQTAKEFLLVNRSDISLRKGGWKFSFVMAQVEHETARLCIQHLYLSQFDQKLDENDECMDEANPGSGNRASDEIQHTQSPSPVERKQFFEYCAEHGASHFDDEAMAGEETLLRKVLSLYDTTSVLFSSWFPIMWRASMPYDDIPEVSDQHAVAFNGHAIVLDRLYQIRYFALEVPDSAGRRALSLAAERGNEAVVKWLLVKGAEVNPQGRGYVNALQAATHHGHEKIVQMLVDAGADVNARRGYYGNALKAASIGGHEKIGQILVDAGANINAQGGAYDNALYAASKEGHEKVVQILIDAGVGVNARGGEYGSALQGASSRGHEKRVQMLVSAGADVNAQGGLCDHALLVASSRGYEKVVQILVNAGADINAQGGLYGNPLQAASSRGHEKIVRILLDAGADVNARGEEYGNALKLASSGGHEEVVRLLINAGADVDAQEESHGNALLAASSGGHEKIVQILVDAGVDVNAQGEYYGRALWAASAGGHEKIMQILVDAGADVNAQGEYGSALCAASTEGREKVVQILVDAGVDVNAQGEYYGRALWAASAGGHEKIVQILVDAGADSNAQGDFGNALYAASTEGHEKIVQILVGAGAKLDAQGGIFGNALDLASFRYPRRSCR